MLTFLILGAGIGVIAGLSPGPVLTMVIAETLKAGWPQAVRGGLARGFLARALSPNPYLL